MPSVEDASQLQSWLPTDWKTLASAAVIVAAAVVAALQRRSWSPISTVARRCFAFARSRKRHLSSTWVQVSGHEGSFLPSNNGMVLKQACDRERIALAALMADTLRPFVPKYTRLVVLNGKEYLEMQDLLAGFHCPAVMDIKMGTRTYLEEELTKVRKHPSYRTDLYQKMVSIDPHEPTAEERERGAIDKPRYMQFREHCSSTCSLGFRLEAIKLPETESRADFKMVRNKEEIVHELYGFLQDNKSAWAGMLGQLNDIREHCQQSSFFHSNEIVGSSLLFARDETANKCGVWIIDFGKTSPLPDGQKLNHRQTWVEGNREDGFLWGLDNLIDIWTHLFDENSASDAGS